MLAVGIGVRAEEQCLWGRPCSGQDVTQKDLLAGMSEKACVRGSKSTSGF